jgi:hypothetical protein
MEKKIMPTYFDVDLNDDVPICSETILYLVKYTQQLAGQSVDMFMLRAASPTVFFELAFDPDIRIKHYWFVDHLWLPIRNAPRAYLAIFPEGKLRTRPLMREEVALYLGVNPLTLDESPFDMPGALEKTRIIFSISFQVQTSSVVEQLIQTPLDQRRLLIIVAINEYLERQQNQTQSIAMQPFADILD